MSDDHPAPDEPRDDNPPPKGAEPEPKPPEPMPHGPQPMPHESKPPEPIDIDSAFAAIVAGWSAERDRPGSDADLDALAGGEPGGPINTPAPLSSPRDWSPAPPDSEAATDDEPGYEPPEPPPLPSGDLRQRLAWGGVIGGPLFLLFAALFWRSAPALLLLAGVGAFVAGFLAMIARMPTHRDDGDDGAVV